MDPAANPEFAAELFETYHGVKIDVEYNVKSEIKVRSDKKTVNFSPHYHRKVA